jgi:hypothetical protein
LTAIFPVVGQSVIGATCAESTAIEPLKRRAASGSSGLGRYRRDRSEIEPSGWPGREGDDPAAGQSLKVKGITAMFCSLTHEKATADANISSPTISHSKGSGLISARVCPAGLHPDAGRRGHQRERKQSPSTGRVQFGKQAA